VEGYSVLCVRPDDTRAGLLADLRDETGFHWTVVASPARAAAVGWPAPAALTTVAAHDALLLQVPDPCPAAALSERLRDLVRAHPEVSLHVLIDSSRADLARELSDVCACGLLLPGLMSPAHMAWQLRDGIDRRRLQRDLHEANTFTSQVIGSAGEGILVLDGDYHVRIWNRAMERLTGVAAPFALGRDARAVFPALADRELANAVQRALWGESDPTCDVHWCSRRTGRTGWLSATFGPHRDADGRVIGVIGLLRDVTKRREAENAVRHLAYHDALTGLPNRRLFQERLRETVANAARYSRRFAVMILDLDRFKEVNDAHGHEAGDRLLRLFAGRLRTLLRKGDLLARMGGDEFVLLLPEVAGEHDVAPVAEKIVAALSEPFLVEGEEVRVTASLGYALHPDDGIDARDLLRRADRAMYRAKEEGRNRHRRSAPS
jgi:diguanylate cyclase (GGDEF)-like protein/PAS domain S-box-containing protein